MKTVAMACAIWCLAGCGGSDLSGPPQVRLGRDQCAACGMIISESRCGSALVVEDKGRRMYALFDDLGCMLDYEAERPEFEVNQRYARDYATSGWMQASGCVYLCGVGERVSTPMGSGMVAFGTRGTATAEKERSGGEVVDYAGLVAARKVWAERRRSERVRTP
ncbi:MAG: nitrous oxide reductase accessory protein NosL [Planctomycetes bacterium]|nr:nitrous oxide reductase accessory protein NosL [Planctomycetota bacterium]